MPGVTYEFRLSTDLEAGFDTTLQTDITAIGTRSAMTMDMGTVQEAYYRVYLDLKPGPGF